MLLLHENDHNIPGDATNLVLSGDNYQALFEESSMPMWILGLPNLNFLAVNQAAILHYGFSREEFLSMTIFDIRSRSEKERLIEEMHQPNFFSALKQQWKHIKKNGQEIIVDITAHDLLFNGSPARVVSIYDITEQILKESKIIGLNQLLIDNERRYKSVIGNALQAIIIAVFEDRWKIVETNQAASDLFGYSEDAFKLLNRSDLLDLQQNNIVADIERRDKTGSVNGEYVGIKKDGQRFHCEINSVVFHDLSGKLWSSTTIADISQRVNAALAQKRDKALLNQAEELTNVGSVEINVFDGSRIWSNGFYRLLGYEPGAIKPDMTVFLEQLYPDDFNKYIAWYNQLINLAIPESQIEIRIRRKDGMIRTLSVSSRSEIDKDGKVVKLFGVIQDISKSKQYEIDLESSKNKIQRDKALLESIINSPKDIFIVSFDKNYCITAFTQRYKDHLKDRFGIDLVLGMNILDVSPPQLRELAKEEFDRALAGEYFVMSRPLEIQPGVWRHYENNFAPIIGDNGKIDGFTVFVHDVNEIKRIEQENRLNELRYSALFSGSSDAIFIAEVDTRKLVDVNQKACNLIGFEKQELIGKEISAIHPKEIMEEISLVFQKFTTDLNPDFEIESFVLHKDGKWIPVSISAGSVFNIGDKKYSAAYFKNMTEHKNIQLNLEKQNSQLKEIAWTQSHVVRAPLARLIGLVKMFKKNLVNPEEESKMIDYILKSANELDQVIHDITNKTVSVEQKGENDMQI